jgi:hypothetical protein
MADMFEPLEKVECQTNQPHGFSLLRQTRDKTLGRIYKCGAAGQS